MAEAGKGGNGRKPPTVVAVEDTTPVDSEPPPSDSEPTTTTVPFDPGGPVTGSLEIADANLVYGGYVTFTATFEGSLSNRGTVYITVVCQGAEPFYQESHFDLSLPFTFADQAGDNLTITVLR